MEGSAFHGFQFSQGFLIRQNSGNEGEIEIEMRNILVCDITNTNNIFFFSPYYPKDNTNPVLYKRHAKIENIRVEGALKQYLFRMSFETLEVKGLYMGADCGKGLVEKFSTAGDTGTDRILITDCMFRNTNTTIFSINLRRDLAAPNYHLTKLEPGKKEVEIEINGCVFVDDRESAAHAPWIDINRDSTAAIIRIKNNVFSANNSGSPLVVDGRSVSGEYASATEISGNVVNGCADPYKFTAATDAVLFIN